MADSCGECLTQPEEYTCGWCKKSNQCSLQSSCSVPNSSWLPNTANCPNPKITRVSIHTLPTHPTPLNLGTHLTAHVLEKSYFKK